VPTLTRPAATGLSVRPDGAIPLGVDPVVGEPHRELAEQDCDAEDRDLQRIKPNRDPEHDRDRTHRDTRPRVARECQRGENSRHSLMLLP